MEATATDWSVHQNNPTPNWLPQNGLIAEATIYQGEIPTEDRLMALRLIEAEIAAMKEEQSKENANHSSTSSSSSSIFESFFESYINGAVNNTQLNEISNANIEDEFISSGARPKRSVGGSRSSTSSSPNLPEINNNLSDLKLSPSTQSLNVAPSYDFGKKRTNPLFNVFVVNIGKGSEEEKNENLKKKFKFWMRPISSTKSTSVAAAAAMPNGNVSPDNSPDNFYLSSFRQLSLKNFHRPCVPVAPNMSSHSLAPKKIVSKVSYYRRCKFCNQALTVDYADKHEKSCANNSAGKPKEPHQYLRDFRPNTDADRQTNRFFAESVGDEEIVELPCEFCERLVIARDLYNHQAMPRESIVSSMKRTNTKDS